MSLLKTIISILFASCVLLVNAQEAKPDSNFVVLKTGETVFGKKVEHTFDRKKEVILVDHKFYSINDVSFYQGDFYDNHGYFAITKGIKSSAPSAAGIVQQGKINLYQTIIITADDNWKGSSGGSTKRIYTYFNTSEFGTVKYANYKNLKPVMQNNTRSMQYLNQYKKQNHLFIGLKAASYGCYLTGLAWGFSSSLKSQDGASSDENFGFFKKPVLIFFGFSIGGFLTNKLSNSVRINNYKNISLAVAAYNKED